MARRNPRREAIIDRVAHAQRAAGKKVSRNESQGRLVKESGYDPRRPMSEVRAMSTPELRKYGRSLEAFVSRKTQFTALFGGKVVPRARADAYRALEQRQNEIASQHEAAILNLKLPGQDMTIGQRLGILPQGGKSIPQANVNFRIFQHIDRPFAFFDSAEGLERETAKMKERIRPGYLGKTVNKRLNSIYALLTGSDNAEFIEKVKGLTLAQKHALLDYSTFGKIAEDRFYPDSADQQAQDLDYELRNGVSRADDIKDQLQQVLDWVVNDVAPAIKGERGNEYREQTPAQLIRTRRVPGAEPDTNAGPIPTQGRVERTPAGPIPVQRGIFHGHRVGDFVVNQRSGNVWQVVARLTDIGGAGAIRVRDIKTGRERFVNPGNYDPLNKRS